MTDETKDDNVFRFGSIQGGKTEDTDADALPINEYVIVTHNGEEHFAEGFLLFTSQHIAVMRETPEGALPVLVVPLVQVVFAQLVEDDDGSEVFDD